MVLVVPYEEFPSTARKLGIKEAFLSARGASTVVTGAHLERDLVIHCLANKALVDVKDELASQKFVTSNGRWTDTIEVTGEGGNPIQDVFYVAAVSYQSREQMPGLWMDAYPTAPTPQIVLRAMYDEFAANGEIDSISYEDFLKKATPNVVILSPSEISTFVALKAECP
jgi:hypothetical protein